MITSRCFKIAEKNSLKFPTTEIELTDRDHAKLWIATHQLGRRNLTDDQRADIANEVREIRSDIAQKEAAIRREAEKASLAKSAKTGVVPVPKPKPAPVNTRQAVAIEAKLPERKIRLAQEIKKVDPVVSAMVRLNTAVANTLREFWRHSTKLLKAVGNGVENLLLLRSCGQEETIPAGKVLP